MKKIKLSLFVKVIIAIALGAALGIVFKGVFASTDEGFGYGLSMFLVRFFKTFNVLFAQLLKFIVPLLVLGLVTPAITNLGRGVGKMLLTVVGMAYCSTVLAGLFAFGCSSAFFPNILSEGAIAPDKVNAMAFEPYIDLQIKPLCDILTALCLSFMIGLGCIYVKGRTLRDWFDEFGEVVKLTIERAIIPLMPLYIFTMMCEMSAAGKFSAVMGVGIKVISTGVVLSILFLVLQYIVAGVIARRNPFKCLWNMLPAYLTGFSICSSSAVIPVTTECTLKNGVREDIANFTIPLCSNVHMCGSVIKLATTAVAVAYMMGSPISLSLFINFVLMLAVATVASPGVMSGVLMASVGFLESILGFSPEMTALLMAIYLALDGYGPACNVTGDGAISLIIDRLFPEKKL